MTRTQRLALGTIAAASAMTLASLCFAQDSSGPFSFAPAIGWYSTPGYSYEPQTFSTPGLAAAPPIDSYVPQQSYYGPSFSDRPSTIPPGPYDSRPAPWER